MILETKLIKEKNLSIAWFEAFKIVNKGGDTYPLIISIDDLPSNPQQLENQDIRNSLDAFLKAKNQSSIHTVSNTLFPWFLWNTKKSREDLYKRHFKITPSIKTCNPNYNGHYFRRMISFDDNYNDNEYIPGKYINQIDHIIKTWEMGTHRHSALQIGIFDPKRDHSSSRQQGFPCLHQISIDPYGTNGKDGIGITAFYPTQLIMRKAYGNYLGLCRLGYFLAHELGLKFVKMNCVISKASIDKNLFRKGDRDKLLQNLNLIDLE